MPRAYPPSLLHGLVAAGRGIPPLPPDNMLPNKESNGRLTGRSRARGSGASGVVAPMVTRVPTRGQPSSLASNGFEM